MLQRAPLYAIERKRAELTAVDLHASELRAQTARLERGLLPSPLLLDDPGVTSSPGTGPAGRTPLLGGDFTTSSKPRIAPCT